MSKRSFSRVCVTWATVISVCGGVVLTGCRTAALIGVIAGAGAVVAIVVIAKYKANARQIAAAKEQVRAVYADAAKPKSERGHPHLTEKARNAATAPEPAAKAGAAQAAKAEKAAAAEVADATPRQIPSTDELDTSGARHLPRFLAVPVPPQNIPAEQGGKGTYMVWDTHRQQLATDDVYVVDRDVRAGSIVKLDGMKAKIAKAE